MNKEQFKNHCKMLQKHIFMPELTDLNTIFKSIVGWENRKQIKNYVYVSVEGQYKIKDTWKSFAAEPTEEFKKLLDEWKIDNRDSISIKLIEWQTGFLIVAQNSLILSDKWLNFLDYDHVVKFFNLKVIN